MGGVFRANCWSLSMRWRIRKNIQNFKWTFRCSTLYYCILLDFSVCNHKCSARNEWLGKLLEVFWKYIKIPSVRSKQTQNLRSKEPGLHQKGRWGQSVKEIRKVGHWEMMELFMISSHGKISVLLGAWDKKTCDSPFEKFSSKVLLCVEPSWTQGEFQMVGNVAEHLFRERWLQRASNLLTINPLDVCPFRMSENTFFNWTKA